MTLDEAQLILNLKREEGIEEVLKNYEHLFKANSSPPSPPQPTSSRTTSPTYSHYLQSKVVRARERIEAEMKLSEPLQPKSSDVNSTSN